MLKRALRIGLLVIGSLPFVALGALEVAYRLLVASIQPAPALRHGAAIDARVGCALWVAAAETSSPPRTIPALYPWSAYRYSGREPGLSLASGVAIEWLRQARERGQVKGMGQWHLKGMAATVWVTRNLSTDEVVARYAELAWAGGSDRGLEAGAHHWYRKSAASLSDAQLAQVVGMIQSPRRYDPRLHPDRAVARRNLVLDRFVDAGCMRSSDLAAAKAEALGISPIS